MQAWRRSGTRRGRLPGGQALGALAVAFLLAALLLRVGLVLGTSPYPVRDDAGDFDRHARSIADAFDYPASLDGPDGGPTAFRPPMYPVFLAAVYGVAGQEHAVEVARLTQALLGLAVVLLIGLICWQLWGRAVALTALAIAACFPPFILTGAALLSETLFVAIALAACAAMVQWQRSGHALRWVVLAGVLCGLAALTRTTGAVLFVPLLLALVLSRRNSWRGVVIPVCAFLAATLATVAPWTIRNAIVLDSFIPVSTQGGHTLAGAYSETLRGTPLSQEVWKPPWSLPDYADLYWKPRFQQRALSAGIPPGDAPMAWRTDIAEPELSRRLSSAARVQLADHPSFVLERAAFNGATLFQLRGPHNAHFSPEEAALESDWAEDAAAYGFYPVLVLALIGAFTATARRAPRWLWLVPIAFLPVVFIDSLMRFRAPVDAFLIMLAAIAIIEITGRMALRAPSDRRPAA